MKVGLVSRAKMKRPSRRDRIGIGVGASNVRVVFLRSGQVKWSGSSSYSREDGFVTPLLELLSQVPRPRVRRMHAVAALGPHFVQVKLLRGLPPTARTSWLVALVKENSERYFLRSIGGSLVYGRPQPTGGGTAWCAAMDAHVATSLHSACAAAGITLDGAVPTAWVLPLISDGEQLEWVDDDAKLAICVAGGLPATIRRSRILGSDVRGTPPHLDGAPVDRGFDTWAFADALGAASSDGGDPLAIDLRGLSEERHVPRWRRPVILTLVAGAIVHLIVGPVLVARATSLRGSTPSTLTAVRAREAQRLAAALRIPVTAVADLHRFRQQRASVISLLGVLSTALEEGTSITTLQFRNGEGRMEVASADLSATIDALQASDSLAEVSLDGPITSHMQAGARLDRAAIRFRWRDATAPQNVAVRIDRRRE